MAKKGLHIIWVLMLVLAVPFTAARATCAAMPVKQLKSAGKADEPVKELVQPQVIHAQATYAHVLLPSLPGECQYEFQAPAAEQIVYASPAPVYQGAGRFFKILFRHFISTLAP